MEREFRVTLVHRGRTADLRLLTCEVLACDKSSQPERTKDRHFHSEDDCTGSASSERECFARDRRVFSGTDLFPPCPHGQPVRRCPHARDPFARVTRSTPSSLPHSPDRRSACGSAAVQSASPSEATIRAANATRSYPTETDCWAVPPGRAGHPGFGPDTCASELGDQELPIQPVPTAQDKSRAKAHECDLTVKNPPFSCSYDQNHQSKSSMSCSTDHPSA
jgi:hypothetical protein